MFDVTAPKRTVVFIGKGLDRSGAKGSQIGEVVTLACKDEEAGRAVALLQGAAARLPGRRPKAWRCHACRDRCARRALQATRNTASWSGPPLRSTFPMPSLPSSSSPGSVKDLNQTTRFAGLSLGGGEGAPTAGAVCTWISGYPLRVSYAGGAPDYDPYRWDVGRMLRDGEGDLLVWIAAISPDLAPPPAKIPTVVLGTPGLALTAYALGVYSRRHPGARSCRASHSCRRCHVLAAEGSRPRGASAGSRNAFGHRSGALGRELPKPCSSS